MAILEIMSQGEDCTAWPRTSCPAGRAAMEYRGAWSPELAHGRQGAHQSNQRNMAVHWHCVARFWEEYEGQIL